MLNLLNQEKVERLTTKLVYPKEFIPGVEKGVLSVADSGILAGFPVIDYANNFIGLHHDVDSSVLAFEIASRMCFREAYKGNFKTSRAYDES